MTVTSAYQWSDSSPRDPGWYWYQGQNWIKPVCIEVFQDSHMWCASELKCDKRTWQAVDNMNGQWAGPIPEPAF